MNLGSQIHDTINLLIQSCKSLMQKVTAEKAVFIMAGKEVEGHVVDLIEIVKTEGDQVMIEKTSDIKKCCEWMIRECVIMKNNPNGKTTEERQALSQKIISQLKITFQNLSVATKNYLKRKEIENNNYDNSPNDNNNDYDNNDNNDYDNDNNYGSNEKRNNNSYNNSAYNNNNNYNNNSNNNGNSNANTNNNMSPIKIPISPRSNEREPISPRGEFTRALGVNRPARASTQQTSSPSPTSSGSFGDYNRQNRIMSENQSPSYSSRNSFLGDARPNSSKPTVRERMTDTNRSATENNNISNEGVPNQRANSIGKRSNSCFERPKFETNTSSSSLPILSSSPSQRGDFLAGKIMTERPASEKTEPVSRGQFDLANVNRARRAPIVSSDANAFGKGKMYRAITQNTRLMMSDADIVSIIMEIIAENCPVQYDKSINSQGQKLEMEKQIQFNFEIFKAKLDMESQKSNKEDPPSTPRQNMNIKITKPEDKTLSDKLLSVGGKQKKTCKEREWGELSLRSNLVKVMNDVCTVFIDALFGLIVEFNDDTPTWSQQLPDTKPKFEIKYIENHPTRKFCVQGANQIIIAIKNLLLDRCAHYNSSDLFSVIYNRALVAADEKRKIFQPIVDKRLFRTAKKSLLLALLHKTETIYNTVSQFVTTLRSTNGSNEYDVFYYCSLSLILIELINQTQEETEQLFYIIELEYSQKPQPGVKLKNSVNVWKDKKTKESNQLVDETFLPGTVDDIIKRMTTSMLNKDLFAAFMYAYPLIVTSKDIWFTLESRYNIPKGHKDAPNPENVKIHQVRVTRWLLDWLKSDVIYPIEDDVVNSIRTFADQLDSDGWFDVALRVKQEINTNARYHLPNIREKPSRIPNYQTYPAYNVITESEPPVIAEQLTLVDWCLYKRVQFSEFENQNYGKETTKIIFSKNIQEILMRINQLSNYVATTIVLQRRLKTRGKLIAKFITVAKICYEMNSFPAVVGIVNGLGHSIVERLIHSWQRISTAQINFYKNLKSIVKGSGSMNLKQHMDQPRMSDIKTVRCIPYIGIYLEDITKIDESMPNTVNSNGVNQINIPKFHQLTSRIYSFLKYQSNAYDFEIEEPIYSFLFVLPNYRLNEFESLSIEREPPGCLSKDLLQ